MGDIIALLVGLVIIWGGLSLFVGPWISAIALIGLFVVDIAVESKASKKHSGSSGFADSDYASCSPEHSASGASEESPWWNDLLPEYYTNGDSRTKTLCGYRYSDGTDSYINQTTGVECRSNGVNAVPTWYDSDIVELYDNSGKYIGREVHYPWGIETYDN